MDFEDQIALLQHFEQYVGKRIEVVSRLNEAQRAFFDGHLKPSTEVMQLGLHGTCLFGRLRVARVSYQNTPPVAGCINLEPGDLWQGVVVTPRGVTVRVLPPA